MERFHRQLLSVFQFKSGRDWAGRWACLGRKTVVKSVPGILIFILQPNLTYLSNLNLPGYMPLPILLIKNIHALEGMSLECWKLACNIIIFSFAAKSFKFFYPEKVERHDTSLNNSESW